jgi:hypothetical protein
MGVMVGVTVNHAAIKVKRARVQGGISTEADATQKVGVLIVRVVPEAFKEEA